jgi:hypothetical protein
MSPPRDAHAYPDQDANRRAPGYGDIYTSGTDCHALSDTDGDGNSDAVPCPDAADRYRRADDRTRQNGA